MADRSKGARSGNRVVSFLLWPIDPKGARSANRVVSFLLWPIDPKGARSANRVALDFAPIVPTI
jgi:hypothetical protein